MKNKFFLTIALLILPVIVLAAPYKTEDPDKKARTKQRSSTQAPATLKFSGYTWRIKSTTGDQRRGPGPNKWAGENVFVDKNGYLHLKITKNADSTWNCAEIIMTEKLGYGTYQWKVEGRIDTLDQHIVLGLFNYSGEDEHDEMDIEFSRWGRANNNNLNYTIWPESGVTTPRNVEYVKTFTLGQPYTTHRFHRTPTSLSFTSVEGFHDGDKDMFGSRTWYKPETSISQLEMPVFINLWLFKGVPPANGQEVELIIREFKFTPLK